ncbi:hypothetical protein TSUD_369900 [Trifolium subterraneum]|uniref:Uncharacterized protein n=1 Tax=Trifolium subterraneum TaxID=3900 RepID=A0A2Z6NLR1_TRISU|nr:hypothetical protein TSUD_369900 [Trifolium subterraneum]
MARQSEIHGNIYPETRRHVRSARCRITSLKTGRGCDCMPFLSQGTLRIVAMLAKWNDSDLEGA